ncbi:hypothetical protein, partial [Pseudomonas sp. GW460-13]|uniref:hypothetical protein n=1 Tax=Pseudomonas sp. GW460-13 TaxID=2070590 RepID=UPI001C46A28E
TACRATEEFLGGGRAVQRGSNGRIAPSLCRDSGCSGCSCCSSSSTSAVGSSRHTVARGAYPGLCIRRGGDP